MTDKNRYILSIFMERAPHVSGCCHADYQHWNPSCPYSWYLRSPRSPWKWARWSSWVGFSAASRVHRPRRYRGRAVNPNPDPLTILVLCQGSTHTCGALTAKCEPARRVAQASSGGRKEVTAQPLRVMIDGSSVCAACHTDLAGSGLFSIVFSCSTVVHDASGPGDRGHPTRSSGKGASRRKDQVQR